MNAIAKFPVPTLVARRRALLFVCSVVACGGNWPVRAISAEAESDDASGEIPAGAVNSNVTKDEWLEYWISRKDFGSPISVSRFLDRTYYLNREVWWEPHVPTKDIGRITAPRGFVTDFASIPRIFWSVLPPDGDYAYSAVIHDWLYWDQSLSRDEADLVLKLSMEELKLPTWKIWIIYRAVRVPQFGERAWNENRRLKQEGERRILKVVPDDATITWEECKTKQCVFQ